MSKLPERLKQHFADMSNDARENSLAILWVYFSEAAAGETLSEKRASLHEKLVPLYGRVTGKAGYNHADAEIMIPEFSFEAFEDIDGIKAVDFQ